MNTQYTVTLTLRAGASSPKIIVLVFASSTEHAAAQAVAQLINDDAIKPIHFLQAATVKEGWA